MNKINDWMVIWLAEIEFTNIHFYFVFLKREMELYNDLQSYFGPLEQKYHAEILKLRYLSALMDILI